MLRVPVSLLGAAAVLALAACADSATKVTAPSDLHPSLSQSPDLNTAGYKKVMKLKDAGEADAKQAQKDMADEASNAAKASRRTSGTGINYHGGPILVQTKVAAIYWATGTIFTNGPTPGTSNVGGNGGDNSVVGDFLRGLSGSPYFNINTTYYDGSNTHVQNVVNYTQFWANKSVVVADNSTSSINDNQMLSMLQSGFDSGNLVYDPTTLYAIFTPGKVNLGGGFGTQYCAYHWYGNVTVLGVSRVVLYAAMPYNYGYPSACTSGYPTADSDRGAATEVNTLAHEIEETTTDGFGNAWWDNQGYENADKCAWTWGTLFTATNGGKYNMTIGGHQVLVQQNWKNVSGGGCGVSL
jgi:hypothetical protein